MESECTLIPYRGFESPPLRQKNQRPPRGAFCFSGRVWLRMRALFDSSSGAAAIEGAQRPSPPLRQTVRHSLSLRPETRECLFLSGTYSVLEAHYRTTWGLSGPITACFWQKSLQRFQVVRDQAGGKPRHSRWPGQSSGRYCILTSRLAMSSTGWRPRTTASTISGARYARRRTRVK